MSKPGATSRRAVRPCDGGRENAGVHGALAAATLRRHAGYGRLESKCKEGRGMLIVKCKLYFSYIEKSAG